MSARRGLARAAPLILALAFVAAGAGEAAPPLPQLCVISSTALRFGAYNSGHAADLASTGNVTFKCTHTQPIMIKIEAGAMHVGSFRALAFKTHLLAYQIYLDATATQIWGDGSGGSQYYSNTSPPSLTAVVVPFYGRIPAHQADLVTGLYSDTMLLQISF